MDSRAASVLYRNIGLEEWPCYNYYKQNVIPLERALLYEYVKTSLYEKQLSLGMLSLYVKPFNPVTNNLLHEKDIMEIRNNQQNRKETEKQEDITERKDTEENTITTELQEQKNQITQTQNKVEEWIRVYNKYKKI